MSWKYIIAALLLAMIVTLFTLPLNAKAEQVKSTAGITFVEPEEKATPKPDRTTLPEKTTPPSGSGPPAGGKEGIGKAPQTGDTSNIFIPVLTGTGAILILIILLLVQRSDNEKDKKQDPNAEKQWTQMKRSVRK